MIQSQQPVPEPRVQRRHDPDAVPAPFQRWQRRDLPRRVSEERRFEEWLFLHAAPVLLSEKTGELLALGLAETGIASADFPTLLDRTCRAWGIDFRILRRDDASWKFLLFDQARLDRVLGQTPCCVLEGRLGYPTPLTTEIFLGELARRWKATGAIPHEIGLALGYPLEDVLGFMGLSDLPCKGACGWRIYGCPREAQRLSCLYQGARCQALAFLARGDQR